MPSEALSRLIGKVKVGATYQLRRHCGCVYRVECLAYDPVNRREVIVYVGLDGHDGGYYFIASPWDFVTKFEPLAEAPP